MSRYLDAVALPRRFGKPDLFITMTANPQWPEITSALPEGSHWTHHPDIVARVFNLKLLAMISLIVKKKIFGDVRALQICQWSLIFFRLKLTCIVLSGRLAECLMRIACLFFATNCCHHVILTKLCGQRFRVHASIQFCTASFAKE
jgi:hypothetical protein